MGGTKTSLESGVGAADLLLRCRGAAEFFPPNRYSQGGLWRNFKAEDLATPEAFARDPRLVWEWYDWRRTLLAKAEPNSGHRALVQLESAKPGFTLITQNVDGLHDRAGSRRPLKLHGDIWRLQCRQCGRNWPDRRAPLPKLPPHCGCGAVARPGVVWFGEPLGEVWAEAEHAARTAQVFLIIGTSALVYPAASLAPIAQAAGARLIEINPEGTTLSAHADASLRGPAGEILPDLVNISRGDGSLDG
jgi:NAD-dependent deacetylase